MEWNPSGSMQSNARPSFDDYVLHGAIVASQPPYCFNEADFEANTLGCFAALFLVNRLLVASDLAKHSTGFVVLSDMIANNSDNLDTDKLEEEWRLTTTLLNAYSSDPYTYDNACILSCAYNAFMNMDSTDIATVSRTNGLIDCVLRELAVPENDCYKNLIASMLWFSDKDGYQAAVIKKYWEIKGGPLPKAEVSDFDTFVEIGAKLAIENEGTNSLPGMFTYLLLSYRLSVAQDIASRFSGFGAYVDAVKTTNALRATGGDWVTSLHSEYDVLFRVLREVYQNDASLGEDLNYMILAASMTAVLDGNPTSDTSPTNVMLLLIEIKDTAIVGLASIALYCVALWFSDRNGYQERLRAELGMG